ncbi:MAG TPA: ATP-dependent DNA helicase RecG [Gammaproteobacteria bacterium]|nr:ATP-dependent DNA helicase RecG [Gammaproteobacteria bacterium]
MAAGTAPDWSADTAVQALRGVGPRLQERLERLGLSTLQDLLFHLPLRYQDRTRVVPMGGLRPGEEAVVEGEVAHSELKYGRRRMLLVHLADGTGRLTLRFFHFRSGLRDQLARGTRLRCFGEVRMGPAGPEIVHPEYRRLAGDGPAAVEESLTPVYPTTEGLGQPTLRELIGQCLTALEEGRLHLPELLPPGAPRGTGLPTLAEAVATLHRPPPDSDRRALEEGAHPARRRLAFEELLAQHLSLRRLRSEVREQAAPVLQPEGPLAAAFREALPFELTGAQERVAARVAEELRSGTPMQRLVQGDVGSGKTVVAALAGLAAVEAGLQAAIMAPTELLAEQHYRNFAAWLEPLGIRVGWLAGRQPAGQRRELLEGIAAGNMQVVVGTHALFQQEVAFDALALVVVDEQHRFGVHQRLALREKGDGEGRRAHQLIMTATPIPRTLAQTAYADLDTSVIDELPPGRTPVETVVVRDDRRDEVVARIHGACAEGRQAYWVCTLVEESDSLQAQAAEETHALLAEALPELRIGLVHGRLKPAQKEAVMAAFKSGEIDLLVATTVIEVGVDVPNASLMIIENAERLGLAQLHQLRGRVGRGSAQSSCVLLYHGPLSETARERLGVLRESNDGFVIARKDLELRGPGELLGTRQTGLLQLKVADLQRDQDLMPQVTELAEAMLAEQPEAVPALVRRWLGEASARYGEV